MKFWSTINKPLPAWLTLVLLCSLTATAAQPSFWTRWVVANAAATPSPAPTGFSGPVVVAQATAAPTPQTGNIDVSGTAQAGGSFLPPLYIAGGSSIGSTGHMFFGTVSIACPGSGACVTGTITLTGASVYTSSVTYACTASVDEVSGPSSLVASFVGWNLSGTQFKFVSTTNSASVTYILPYTCAGY